MVTPNVAVPTPRNRKLAGWIKEKALIPVLVFVVGIVVLDPIKGWWSGPHAYKIYLVGKQENKEIAKIFSGFKLGSKLDSLKIDDVDVVVEEIEDDRNAPDVAKELAARDDTLLVIGHVYSQRTIDALPVYMGASPAIPLIATKETNPDLLRLVPACAKGISDCPLIQMSPTDDEQASDAVDFALKKLRAQNQAASRRFLIVKQDNDADNKSYVDYLTSRYQGLLARPEYTQQGSVLVGTVNIVDANSYVQIITTVQTLKPDCLLFVGQFPAAQQFLSAFQDVSKGLSSQPIIMLPDAAINPAILEKGFGPIASVYATYPLSSSQYAEPDSILGRDAYAIIREIVKDVGPHRPILLGTTWKYRLRRLLQMHRVTDARSALDIVMIAGVKASRTFVGPTNNEYRFVSPYRRVGAKFHVWNIQDKQIMDVDEMDGKVTEAPTVGKTFTSQVTQPAEMRGRTVNSSSRASNFESLARSNSPTMH
jgi:hypothetical protein